MRACAGLGRLDQNTSDAVKVRQEVDLRIGELCTMKQCLKPCTFILYDKEGRKKQPRSNKASIKKCFWFRVY